MSFPEQLTNRLENCRGGTPWPPQRRMIQWFKNEGVVQRWGGQECRPYNFYRRTSTSMGLASFDSYPSGQLEIVIP